MLKGIKELIKSRGKMDTQRKGPGVWGHCLSREISHCWKSHSQLSSPFDRLVKVREAEIKAHGLQRGISDEYALL